MASTTTNGAPAERAVPTYADLFPELNSLAGGGGSGNLLINQDFAGSVRSTTTTTVFRIGIEENRFGKNTYGDDGRQKRIIDEVQREHEVMIDLSYTHNDTLCMVVTGKGKNVHAAKLQLVRKLQKQAEIEMVIPPAHYRAIIGRGGETLKGIQNETGARIKIPSADETAGVIKISGTAEGCAKARNMIQYISDVEAKRDRKVLEILRAYHPLIAGYKNGTIKRIQQSTGASIHIPPASRNIDEIVVSGEKEGVHNAAAQLLQIYEEKRRTCGELTAQVKKSQHRYIIGPRGANLDAIMEKYCVVVEIPPPEVETDTIVLRGEQPNLVSALTMVYERATSMTSDELEVPGWLHGHLIGRRGKFLSEMCKPFEKATVDFDADANLVKLEGPPTEVAGLKTVLQAKRDELINTISFTEVKVKPEYHSRIIGKGGASISKIKEDTGVQVRFPKPDSDDKADVIRIEGPKEGVTSAKKSIIELVKKFENYTETKFKVEQRLHSLIIGSGGSQIKKLLTECGDVSLDVPKSKVVSDEITVSGEKSIVDKALQYLKKLVGTLREENFILEVPIFKPYHASVIGKSGVTVNKIKAVTGCRIDIPNASDASDLITITGHRGKCEKAKEMILKVQNDIATIVTEKASLSPDLQKSLGKTVLPSLLQSCGGVQISGLNKGSKFVQLQGPVDDVTKAKDSITDLASILDGGSIILEVAAPRKFFRQLVGRQGAALSALEKECGAQIFVPPSKQDSDECMVLVGTREACEKGKAAILARVAELENLTKGSVAVDKKYHRQLLARKSKFLNDLKTDTNVSVQIPKDDSEELKLEGPKSTMDAAIQAIKDFVAEIDARVTVKVSIPARDHKVFFGNGASTLLKITDEHNVSIQFPERKDGPGRNRSGGAAKSANGAANKTNEDTNSEKDEDNSSTDIRPEDTVTITGLPDRCSAAEAALREQLPVEESIDIDPDFHRFIIGRGGEAIRKFMAEHNVNVKFPSAKDSSTVTVRGNKELVPEAVAALKKRCTELEADKADRELKSFEVVLTVDPRLHMRLIGKQGAVVNRLREAHGVDVDFPDKRKKLSAVAAKTITVRGYEEAAKKAADEIMGMVSELESLVVITISVNPKCHRKIIGRGGETIKSLQKDYGVRVIMPRDEGTKIKIEGPEEGALACKDALLEIEEDWKQEEDESEESNQYVRPSRYDQKPEKKEKKQAFQMRDAPWEKPPNANDSGAFPGLGGGAAKPASGGVWVRR